MAIFAMTPSHRKAASSSVYRGPWYTVGYPMAVTIERELGRPALVATLADPREFVTRYSESAAIENAKKRGHLLLFYA